MFFSCLAGILIPWADRWAERSPWNQPILFYQEWESAPGSWEMMLCLPESWREELVSA